jgi:hypothetical protein
VEHYVAYYDPQRRRLLRQRNYDEQKAMDRDYNREARLIRQELRRGLTSHVRQQAAMRGKIKRVR